MYTDPTRAKATDPGHIEGNVVFIYLDAFYSDKENLEELKDLYRQGKIGDAETKELLTKTLNSFLAPIREKRAYYLSRPEEVRSALLEGTERARKTAQATMAEVREAMRITNYENIKNIQKN